MVSHSIEEARRLVREAATVVVITGAGVSTASGISDFRGPEVVWTKDPSAERLSNIDAFMASAEVRTAAWRRALEASTRSFEPNPAHRALVDFEGTGKLTALVTQNIDGLHLAAGSSPDLVDEVHGNTRITRCLRCGDETPTARILERVVGGDVDPHCRELVAGESCDGFLKTAVVSFGQPLPTQEFAWAELRAKTCDLLVCVGSTLMVHPVAGLVPKALSRGASLIILNAEPTAYDGEADVVLRGDIPTVLPSVLAPASTM